MMMNLLVGNGGGLFGCNLTVGVSFELTVKFSCSACGVRLERALPIPNGYPPLLNISLPEGWSLFDHGLICEKHESVVQPRGIGASPAG